MNSSASEESVYSDSESEESQYSQSYYRDYGPDGEVLTLVNKKDKNGNNNLQLAVKDGNEVLVVALIGYAQDDFPLGMEYSNLCRNHILTFITDKNEDGHSALDLAIQSGNLNIIAHLLEHYLTVELRFDEERLDNKFYNKMLLFNFAGKARKKYQHFLPYLIQKHIRDSIDCGMVSLPTAAYNRSIGNKNGLNSLVQRQIRQYMNSTDDSGKAAIHYAAEYGNVDNLTSFLTNYGADYNTVDKKGMTPLHHAAKNNEYDAIVFLISFVQSNNPHKKDAVKEFINKKTTSGETALYLIVQQRRNNTDMITYFLNHGAEYNTKGDNNMTMLHYAAKYSQMNILQILITHVQNKNSEMLKSYINEKDNEKKTALEYNIEFLPNPDVATYLLNHGAEFNNNINNITKLHKFAENGRKDILMVLFTHLENNNPDLLKEVINTKDTDGYTALLWFIRKDDLEMVTYLIDHGAQYDIKESRHNLTPLHLAALNGHINLLKWLIAYVHDNNPYILKRLISEKDTMGNTAIEFAILKGFFKEIKTFLEHYSIDYLLNKLH